MNSRIDHMVGLAKRGALAIALSTAMVALTAPAAFANGGTWALDSNASDASLYQGSAANPHALNTGMARVTGKVKLDTNDLDQSAFDLRIYPAAEDWANALSPEGNLPAGYVPDANDHTLLTFRSKHILRTQGGGLEVTGDLTLTRVERSATIEPSEAYSGPVYSDPVVRTETREATFVIASVDAPLVPGSSTPTAAENRGALRVSASAQVGYEDFPELFSALTETNWPLAVEYGSCQIPSTISEDYSGALCTGPSTVATRDDTPIGRKQTTIILHLKLVNTGSEPSVAMLSANGGTR
jgi:polyisoprenoid-binding protein YceI